MAEVINIIKLQITGGKANPAPPVGTALGPTGINMQDFCSQFNDATKDRMGEVTPVEISIYDDRTFSFITKVTPAANLILKAANIKKGSGEPHENKVATLSWKQVQEIAEVKMPDLNANDIENAARIIAGTARSMGVVVEGIPEKE